MKTTYIFHIFILICFVFCFLEGNEQGNTAKKRIAGNSRSDGQENRKQADKAGKIKSQQANEGSTPSGEGKNGAKEKTAKKSRQANQVSQFSAEGENGRKEDKTAKKRKNNPPQQNKKKTKKTTGKLAVPNTKILAYPIHCIQN